MRFKKQYLIGVFLGLLLIVLDVYFFMSFNPLVIERWFYPGLIIAINVGWSFALVDFLMENKRQKEIETMFLEFVRSLEENVRSGVSIPRAILNLREGDYGALSPYVKKLANQIDWGIPVQEAMNTFANDTENNVIKRSIAIVIEAEASGGDIADVLGSVTNSVMDVKKMKHDIKAGTYSQIVQGYIVYFVFIGIMLILQLKLFPQLADLGGGLSSGLSAIGTGGISGSGDAELLDRIFFYLIMIQGFFAGLMIGRFSEGTIRQGLLHSLILVTLGALIITTVKGGI